ncbi:hypothetical protein ACIRYZ_41990 [Kitasatospora sp. NPDC101155]|uniref:hypothetical protein n=1 Tax=Kitasatospora sp. NPDC101155 TaxID=3364097 RepID=UPI00382D73C7
MRKRILRAAVAVAAAGVFGLVSSPAGATPNTRAAIVAHFDLAKGQTPENAATEPDGSLDVTFSIARQVARVDADGTTHILATMPLPADGGVNTPVLHVATTMGIVRDADGALYFLYAAGAADLTGVWRLRPHGIPERIAPLPAAALPNGLALDQRHGMLYIADSALGTIWTVHTTGGRATAWSTAPELAFSSIAGANGLKIHNNALWVSNTDKGIIVRIPFRPGRRPGPVQTRATGLTTVDDFAFTGGGDEILAALNHVNQVVRIRPDGSHSTVLTAADGLQNPTAIQVRHGTVYVLDAAYVTAEDPNLLTVGLRDLR